MEARECHVIIIGAGLGGLATAIAIRKAGHKVTILEQAAELSEIGAGIEIPPNSTRILKQLDVLDDVRSYSIQPDKLQLRSYRDGTILSRMDLVPHMEDTYGAPWLLIHRANFQKVLAAKADSLGVDIRLGYSVKKDALSNLYLPSACGDVQLHADAVLGSDGLHSICRAEVQSGTLRTTGDIAYRITIKAEDMRKHDELVGLLESPNINAWMGPGAHVVSYVLKGTGLYNFVFICRVHLDSVEDMKEFFSQWDTRLQMLLNIAKESRKWDLHTSDEMDTWLHPQRNMTLLGDACHAMVPYLAQGAAQAVEDAAVLGALFGILEHKSQLRDILVTYEQLRKPRASRIVNDSTANGGILHMPDGPAQMERDRQLQQDPPSEGYPNRWADPVYQRWLFEYDPRAEVEKAWSTRLSQREASALE